MSWLRSPALSPRSLPHIISLNLHKDYLHLHTSLSCSFLFILLALSVGLLCLYTPDPVPSLLLPFFYWENRCWFPNKWGKGQYPWTKIFWEVFPWSANSFYACQVIGLHHKPITKLDKVWEFSIWYWLRGMGDARLRDSWRLDGDWHHVVNLKLVKGSKDRVLWYSSSCIQDSRLLKMPRRP